MAANTVMMPIDPRNPELVTTPNLSWAMEYRLSRPKKDKGHPESLHQLQSWEHPIEAHLMVGNECLELNKAHKVQFIMDLDPLGHAFVLEVQLRPYPVGRISTPKEKEAMERYRSDRILMVCVAENGQSTEDLRPRIPQVFTGLGTTMPMQQGPIDFSTDLYDVHWSSYPQSSWYRRQNVPRWPTEPQHEVSQSVFTWKTKEPLIVGSSIPPRDLPPTGAAALEKIRVMFEKLTKHGMSMEVLLKPEGRQVRLATNWSRFCALPNPIPMPCWPWVTKYNPEKPEETLPGGVAFHPAWVKASMCNRGRESWFDQAPHTLPEEVKIVALRPKQFFHDWRDYTAYIIGTLKYEEQANASHHRENLDGDQHCELFPDEQVSNQYTFLLRVSVPENAIDPEAYLPEHGERVDAALTLDAKLGEEEWKGTVIEMPDWAQAYNYNVAFVASRPAIGGGRVMAQQVAKCTLHFGHHGAQIHNLVKAVLRTMTGIGTLPTMVHTVRKLLLGRYGHSFNTPLKENYLDQVNPDWKKVVSESCTRHGLNPEQVQTVRHAFTHTVTVVVGPPGTGKSALAKVLLEIAEKLNEKYWVATGSNAALDVLAKRACDMKGSNTPPDIYRLWTASGESVSDDFDTGELFKRLQARGFFKDQLLLTAPSSAGDEAGPSSETVESLAAAAVEALSLQEGETREDRPRPVDNTGSYARLEYKIRARLEHLAQTGSQFVNTFKDERDTLGLYLLARNLAKRTRSENAEEVTALQALEKRLRKQTTSLLRDLQQAYVGKAKGILTTSGNANTLLADDYKGNFVLIDEGSQIGEATAISPILRAAAQGGLRRIVIIGDPDQLPPTVKNGDNPFREQGNISLLERLMKTGVTPLRLREQYRMHPTIAAPISDIVYDGQLRSSPSTEKRPTLMTFWTWLQGFAKAHNARFPRTHNVMLSPVKQARHVWGSQPLAGSESRINTLTAHIVVKTAMSLVRGGFPAKNIMISTFYSGQLQLLKALCKAIPEVADARFLTVDASQGEEELVNIVDCTRLGAAAGESAGFMGADKRRPNVALTRAKCGLLLVCRKDFVKDTYGNDFNLTTELLNLVQGFPLWSAGGNRMVIECLRKVDYEAN